MNKLKIIIYFFSIFIIINSANSKIEIKYKVDNEIITNIDILNEKNYLIFLRPNLKNLTEDEILKISKNSLIREFIKKKEINKVYKNIKNDSFNDEIKKNLFAFKRVKNEKEFLELIKNHNITYDKILEKMKYEGLWNELILRKFNSSVKIDEKKLKEELLIKISNDKKYEYYLSEIVFEIENNQIFEKKFKEIKEYIIKNNFKLAATKYSISNSSNKGGEIGWVKETVLSAKFVNALKKLKENQITKPIKHPNGYLILKINKKREMKQVVSIDRELKDRIKFEKNRQLNQFSLLFYKKLKQNTKINEY